jgi:superfamily I DNA and/or RNA helicase
VPLIRLHRPPPTDGIVQLRQKRQRQTDAPRDTDVIAGSRWCVIGTTPGGVYRMLKNRWNTLVGHQFCDCLVLDEASQMNLPEAMMAALALKDDAPLIVVGDHRQMPPIVKHDWASEARRTFQEFRTYESLFRTLVPLPMPLIQFEESFRLHADMAEFFRREVYAQDGIAYFSQREQTLPASEHPDPFIASILRPEQTMVVVIHDEEESIVRNSFEQGLITAILEALAAPPYDLEAEHGLGVVVPHRAQRAALQQAVPRLNVVDPLTGEVVHSAVDTV